MPPFWQVLTSITMNRQKANQRTQNILALQDLKKIREMGKFLQINKVMDKTGVKSSN